MTKEHRMEPLIRSICERWGIQRPDFASDEEIRSFFRIYTGLFALYGNNATAERSYIRTEIPELKGMSIANMIALGRVLEAGEFVALINGQR